MRKIFYILALLVCTCSDLFSQKILTPEEAVKIALENNYGIKVAANQQEINRINNTAGNAGMLPTAGINASDNYSFLTNSLLEYNSGDKLTRSNGTSNSINAGIDIGWTLFDGGRMFVTRAKLREIEAAGQYRYQDQLFQAIYDVITAYYNVVRQKQQLRSYQE
jgi:outer membrane protein TolC